MYVERTYHSSTKEVLHASCEEQKIPQKKKEEKPTQSQENIRERVPKAQDRQAGESGKDGKTNDATEVRLLKVNKSTSTSHVCLRIRL